MATRLGILASFPAYREHLQPVADALAIEVTDTVDARPAWLVASYRDFVSAGKADHRIMSEHGCGLETYSPGKWNRLELASLAAVPNDWVAQWYRDHGVPTEVVGTPKMDRLSLLPDPEDGVVAVSLHWTGANRARRWLEPFRALAERHQVIGHGHPRAMRTLRPLYKLAGIEVVESFTEVCKRASVYACDHSSTLFEFAALNRPVVLLEPDHWEGRFSGLRYGLGGDIGPHVGPADLPDVFPLKDEWGDRRRRISEYLYPHMGHATERMAALVREWA